MSQDLNGSRQKRRRFLIYPKFQLTLIGVNLAVILGVLGIVGLQSWRSMQRLAQLGIEAGLAANHPYFEFLSVQARTLHSYLAVGAVVGFVVSSAVFLVVSHRLAGPLVRLRSYFGRLKETGEYRPISFRKNDYLSELPQAINEGLESLQEKSRKAS